MAQITINEVSSNYSYNIGTSSFCTVALPITASWGPAYEDSAALGIDEQAALERTAFSHFQASQAGLERFISTYRGPAANYRSAKDYSYQVAMTLLASGYDIEVCRLCPGNHASATIYANAPEGEAKPSLTFKAKYPGSFGNSLQVDLKKSAFSNTWNYIVYVVDSAGARTALENKVFVFDLDRSTDTILHISEIESKFITFEVNGIHTDEIIFEENLVSLEGGSDRAEETADIGTMISEAIEIAQIRYDMVPASSSSAYINALSTAGATADRATASKLRYNEWIYTSAMKVLDLLTDKLAYNFNRLILPGWDDQNITEIVPESDMSTIPLSISPLHAKLMETAYNSRCGTAYIDIPKCLPRSKVYNNSSVDLEEGYAQKLSRYNAGNNSDGLFATHSALFAPWGQYKYVGTGKQAVASPSFLALMIQRAMILNQTLQYEWVLPSTRKHNLSIGKLDYIVPKAELDVWQSKEGTALNVIANIPDLGTSVWGNSTLYEVPEATYNALQNLSSRLLINAIENTAYRCGLSITFQYNNDEAYSKFYAGVSPLLDTMKNVNAIEDYRIMMSADINGLDNVNANSVLGQIYVSLYGVINDITIDLVALPQGTDLSVF